MSCLELGLIAFTDRQLSLFELMRLKLVLANSVAFILASRNLLSVDEFSINCMNSYTPYQSSK